MKIRSKSRCITPIQLEQARCPSHMIITLVNSIAEDLDPRKDLLDFKWRVNLVLEGDVLQITAYFIIKEKAMKGILMTECKQGEN